MVEIGILRLCYFTCLNFIFVKIFGDFQLGHHYYCLTVPGHVLATTSSNEYAKYTTLDFTMLSTLQYTRTYEVISKWYYHVMLQYDWIIKSDIYDNISLTYSMV